MRILATALVLALACTPPSLQRQVFDCRVDALQAVTGDVLDAAELARDLYAGRADLRAVVSALKLSREQTMTLVARLNACENPEGAPPAPVLASDAGASE